MNEEDAGREGFHSLSEFEEYWKKFGYWNPGEEVWVIGFTLLQEESQAAVLKNLVSVIQSFA